MDSAEGEWLLRVHGLRATPQRLVVLEALMALSHPDADEIFAYAASRQSSISLATVYNVLDKLRGSGLAALLEVHGRRCFDWRVDHHDHIYCRQCGRLADVRRDKDTRLVRPMVQDWIIQDPALVWEGRCPSCRDD